MKKFVSLFLCMVFVLSLTACGRTMDNMTSDIKSDGESVIDDAESMIDNAKSQLSDTDDKMNLMAGITANDALDAALEHAGVDESQTSDVDIDLDRDGGKLIYEVDFNIGNTEYDYDINAETGEVISADKSMD